jgi:hypothetical protein
MENTAVSTPAILALIGTKSQARRKNKQAVAPEA